MDKYIPCIGDVVLDNGMPVVVGELINYETMASCGYDRKYLLVDEGYLRSNTGIITMSDLEQHGRWVSIRGVFPEIEKVDAIPFRIKEIDAYQIEEKVAKTITVYE